MRKRRWALFAFIIMLALIFLSLESWRFFKANEKLKDYFLTEFRPIVGELAISKVHVSFGNIHILGVRFAAPAKNISIDIRDLRIGYSFLNLLVFGFHPKYISQDALFIGPTITIHPTDTLVENFGSAAPARSYSALSKNLDLDIFRHISIKDGEIVYRQDDTTLVPLAHSVQGGIYKQDGDSLFIDLDGAFFNSEDRNIRIVGSGDFKRRIITHVEATLADYALQHGLPLLRGEWLTLDRGELNGMVYVEWQKQTGRYQVTGDLEIDDAGGDILGDLFVSDLSARVELQDDKIIVRRSEQTVNHSRITIAGVLENLRDPVVNLTGESTHFDIGAFSSLLGPQFRKQLSGVSAVKISVSGALHDIVVRQNIRAGALYFKNTLLTDVYADLSFDGETVTIDSSRAVVQDNEISLNGVIDLTTENRSIQGELKGHGDMTSFLAPAHIDSSISVSSTFHSILSGSIRQPLLDGKVSLLARSDQDSLALDASFSYQDERVTVRANAPQQGGVDFHSTIDWGQSPPAIMAQCQGVEKVLFFFWEIPAENYLADHIQSSVMAFGDFDRIQLQADIASITDGRVEGRLVRIDAGIKRHSASFKSDGFFVLNGDAPNAARGEFSLEKTEKALILKELAIEDEMTASLNIDLQRAREMTGVLELTGFDITRLLTRSDSSLAGKVSSTLKVKGTLSHPTIEGLIDIDELLYRGVGPYESRLQFDYRDLLFNLDRFTVNYGKSTLLYAYGRYDGKSDALDFSVKGAGFDAGHILGVAGKDSLISGAALIDLIVSGSSSLPIVAGTVAIKDGRLLGTPFDELELELAPPIGSDRQPASTSAIIENLRLTRFNVYEILASGIVPFRDTDSLVLDINGQGNFLQILQDTWSFFRSPHGNCSLTGRVRGTPMNPYLEKARLTVDDASMEFASVVSPVAHVKGELSFDADEQFLHISDLQGEMGGKPFRIYNDLADNVVSAKPLANMHIGETGFHLGALILETPQKGVPLNFVGIMEPGDFGMLELVGRTGDEKFYFAGSPDGLTLRGRINLYDTEIMYPFYDGGHIGSSKLRDFLRNLDWDLFVVPTKNTRFSRSFAGALAEAYVDLKLDENFGGLEFTDRIVDETFRINGHVRSTKGIIEYLNMNFRVEQAGVDFDRSSLMPVAYGSAKTTVTDSLGISSNILLTLQTVDNTMDKKSVDDIVRQEEERARFNQIRFKLSSDNPNIGNSEAQILASLGYSTNNLQSNAVSAIGYGTDNLIFRPLFRPVEKELEQIFGFDYVRFSSQLTRNIIMFNLNNNLELNNRLALLESTKIIVGKYLANHFFLQYTGQIESGVGYRYKEKNLGWHHTVGLEYQINPQVLVELEYDYDSLMLERRDDKRIILRHWFPF